VANPPAIELVPRVFRIPTVGSWQINSYAFVDDDGSVTLVDTGPVLAGRTPVRAARPR
jgi:hypothetical protein